MLCDLLTWQYLKKLLHFIAYNTYLFILWLSVQLSKSATLYKYTNLFIKHNPTAFHSTHPGTQMN